MGLRTDSTGCAVELQMHCSARSPFRLLFRSTPKKVIESFQPRCELNLLLRVSTLKFPMQSRSDHEMIPSSVVTNKALHFRSRWRPCSLSFSVTFIYTPISSVCLSRSCLRLGVFKPRTGQGKHSDTILGTARGL